MVAQFDRKLIPTWKELGLCDYEIFWLVHKLSYDALYLDGRRQLIEEKEMIINWINMGLTDAEIARLLLVSVSSVDNQVKTWENGDELFKKLEVSHVKRRAVIDRLK